MSPFPSRKKLVEWFGDYFEHGGIDPNVGAEQIRKFAEPILAGRGPVDRRGAPAGPVDILHFVNVLIRGSGVKAITTREVRIGDTVLIVAWYVNVEDPDMPTLIYETGQFHSVKKWHLTTLRDWVDKNKRKYGGFSGA